MKKRTKFKEYFRYFCRSENDARKDEIAKLNDFAKDENDARKEEIADLYDK